MDRKGQCFFAALLFVPEQTVIESTTKICSQKTVFEELCVLQTNADEMQTQQEQDRDEKVPVFQFVPQKEREYQFELQTAEKHSVEELIPLLYGNITQGTSTLGSAGIRVPGSAGETTEALEEKYGLRSLIMADGPAGLRLRQSYEVDRQTDRVYGVGVLGSLENGFLEQMEHHKDADIYYQYCTAFPVGTALAQTWNMELAHRFGEAIATEMEEFHVDLWLAPGMNIQRNPLCGRNFEYYSEDPVVSGCMAAAITKGVQSKKGYGTTIKHFACNSQEDNRMGSDSVLGERTLREIYLKGFEIAIKESNPMSVMTSYNLVNGIHAANHYDLCTKILRNEWNYKGLVMTDWTTTMQGDGCTAAGCMRAGNDIVMPGCAKDHENIRQELANGSLDIRELKRSVARLVNIVWQSDRYVDE